MTKLLTLDILFSIAATSLVLAKLVILGILLLISFMLALKAASVVRLVKLVILPLTSFILYLRVVFVAEPVTSGILYSIFFISALHTSFLTASFFTTSLNLLESTGTGIYLSTSNLSILLLKLVKLVREFLSTLDFKLAKSTYLDNFVVSAPVAFFKSVFVEQLDKFNSTFTLPPADFGSAKCSLIYAMSFLSVLLLKELS